MIFAGIRLMSFLTRRRLLRLAGMLAVLSAPCVRGADKSAFSDAELVKLADGVFVSVGNPEGNAVSNAGVVILANEVLVFDTQFTPEAGQLLLAGIQGLTTKPVTILVNSHFHSDHTHGNQAFSKAHTILASGNGRRDILQRDAPALGRAVSTAQAQIDRQRKDANASKLPAQRDAIMRQIAVRKEALDRLLRLKIILPTMTFDDMVTIQDDAREIRLLYLGAGHTDGDVILFLPAEKVVFLGDLFFNAAFPNSQDANMLAWIDTLQKALELDAAKFVPGHGSPGTKKEVGEFLDYLKDLKSIVEPFVARGDSLDQLIRDTPIPAKYASYRFPAFFPANLQTMYTQLKALQLASAAESEPAARKSPPEKPEP